MDLLIASVKTGSLLSKSQFGHKLRRKTSAQPRGNSTKDFLSPLQLNAYRSAEEPGWD